MVPQTSIGVHELTLTELLPAVRAGQVSLAVAPEGPGDDPGDESLAAMALWTETATVAMAADHPLAAARRLMPDALLATVMLLSTDRADGEMQRFLLGRVFTGTRPPVSARPGRGDALMARVAAGEGVALVLASHELPAGVVTRPLAVPAARFTVHALWQADQRSAPLATLLRLLHGARSAEVVAG